MVEPVTTAAAATAAATGASGAAGSAGAAGAAVPLPSDGGFFSGIFDSVSSFITAPFRWVASLPGKIFGTVTGAFTGAFNLGNLPVAAVVAGVETLVTVSSPETAVSARVLAGMSEEGARKAVADIAKDGITGVALNSGLHGLAVAAGLGAASGASEGAGGGLTGMLAGVGVVAAGIYALSNLPSPDTTPVTDPTARTKAEPQKA